MPQINKLQRRKRPQQEKKTDMQQLRAEAYNNRAWRKMRDTYMHEHPCCEKCLEKGKVKPAEDIHHKVSPFKGGEVNYNLLLDYDNLMAVCKECHGEIHAEQQGHISPEDVLRQLDALFNPEISDKDIEEGDY